MGKPEKGDAALLQGACHPKELRPFLLTALGADLLTPPHPGPKVSLCRQCPLSFASARLKKPLVYNQEISRLPVLRCECKVKPCSTA
jgi:hypothetical protein